MQRDIIHINNLIGGVLNYFANNTNKGGNPFQTPSFIGGYGSVPQILSMAKFDAIYKQANHTIKDAAGAIILDETFSEILLVRGRISKKWGPPKGHREGNESNLETAIRETCEEIGHIVKLKVNLLPYVVINKIKLYCLIVSKSTKFQIRDRREIADLKWFKMTQLISNLKNHANDYTASIRGLFCNTHTIKTLNHKISSFKINYRSAGRDSS